MTFNNAGESTSRQVPNPALDDLLVRLELASKACDRWMRRLENTHAKLPDPEIELVAISQLEQQGQAVLQSPKKPAGRSRIEVELWLETGMQKQFLDLDPTRTPQDQAKDWIATAKKKRRGLGILQSRTEILEAEQLEALAWKERLAIWANPPDATTKAQIRDREAALDGLVQRLLPRGLWPQPPRTRDAEVKTGPIRWDLPGGWILLAGRSGTENDLLTQRIALAHDLWFHAAHVPGSHVILRSPNGKPAPVPPELAETAAGVAAWLSKLRAQTLADVLVTEKRHVRKPRKAPPGTVVLEHSRTMRVKPVPPPR